MEKRTYQERRLQLEKDMQEERVGCPQAWKAAQEDRVLYAPIIQGHLPASTKKTLLHFTYVREFQERYRTLALLPVRETPLNFEEGANYAYDTYQRIFWLLRGREMQRYIAHEKAHDSDGLRTFYQTVVHFRRLHERGIGNEEENLGVSWEWMRESVLKHSFSCDELRESLLQSFDVGGYPGLNYTDSKRPLSGDALFLVAVAPYYSSNESAGHARHANDFAIMVNRMRDIEWLYENRAGDFSETERWSRKMYSGRTTQHGAHPPVKIPIQDEPDVAAWKAMGLL